MWTLISYSPEVSNSLSVEKHFQYNCTADLWEHHLLQPSRMKGVKDRDLNAYLPVVVHVAQLVGKPLHMIRLQSAGVVHDIVVGWGDAPRANRLAHDEEVVPDQGCNSSVLNTLMKR